MTDTPTERGEEGAWAKLHRRKAVQWGLAYVAAAWALLQGIGFLDDAFHWPDFAKQVETIDLAVGLPIVPVVARVSRRSWPAAHEREATSKGKTEPHSNLAGGQSRDQRPSRATTLKCGCEYGEDAVKALCPAHMAEWNETHGRWAEQCRRMDADGGR